MGNEKPRDSPQERVTLDDVLVNELGQLGWYQIRNGLLLATILIGEGLLAAYIFTAGPIPHRCAIQECGEGRNASFDPEWIVNAIPMEGSELSTCTRYKSLVNGSVEYCPEELFNRSTLVPCTDYVYASDNSIVNEFDLGCDEWRRALVGVVHSSGHLLSLAVIGLTADRFGRRPVLVCNILGLAVAGIGRAFSPNYPTFVALTFAQIMLGGGFASISFVLGAELMGPKYRNMVCPTGLCFLSVGEIATGLLARAIQNWRLYTLVVNAPFVLMLSYYWFLPESIRWLLSKEKFEEAQKLLENVARVNKTTISTKSMAALLCAPTEKDSENNNHTMKDIMRSRVMRRRVFTTPVWWFAVFLVFVGLNITSVDLAGDMYFNFLLTAAAELPGFIAAMFLLNRIGRKTTSLVAFLLSGICNIAVIFVPDDMSTARLALYVVSKMGCACAVATVSQFTNELYPTSNRAALVALSTFFGRAGHLTAQCMPALKLYWEHMPPAIFGIVMLVAGLLTLTQPETMGTKLPDTLQEAEALGTGPKEKCHFAPASSIGSLVSHLVRRMSRTI